MNKLSESDLSSLKKAITLQKKDRDFEAIGILKNLIKQYPENSRVIGFLGLFLRKTKNHLEAGPYLKKAIILYPKNELLHLSLYLNYAEQEEFEKAFDTLFAYLDNNPAELFKDTLEELLDGLINGYGTNFKDKIIIHAKKNDVRIPKKLLD